MILYEKRLLGPNSNNTYKQLTNFPQCYFDSVWSVIQLLVIRPEIYRRKFLGFSIKNGGKSCSSWKSFKHSVQLAYMHDFWQDNCKSLWNAKTCGQMSIQAQQKPLDCNHLCANLCLIPSAYVWNALLLSVSPRLQSVSVWN